MEKPSSLSTNNNLIQLINTLRTSQLSLVDWQTEKLNFIPLRGSWFANSEADFDLDEQIDKFISPQNNKQVMLLMGDSGAGKSLYTQGLVNKLWQNFSAQSPIPIWISLPSLRDPLNKAIEEIFGKYGFNNDQIEELRKTRPFLFILDAYDEIRCEKNLYQTNNLDQWNAKIIFTCRREYLYHKDNYKLFFVPFIGDKAQYSQYHEIVICPFNINQIQNYVDKYVKTQVAIWKESEKYQRAFNELSGLIELIRTPFIMKLAMEALPQIVEKYSSANSKEKASITRAALYDIFIEQWFIRQEKKLKEAKQIKESEDIKPEFWTYAKELATEMHKANLTQVNYNSNEESDLFGAETKENIWSKFFTPKNPRIELLRTACLVREVNQYHYAFIHSSLLEYFLTRNICENMTEKEIITKKLDPQNESIKSKEDNLDNQKSTNLINKDDHFNHQLIVKESGVLQFLADRVSDNKTLEKSLFDKVLSSKNNPTMKIAAANAISVLNLAKISFTEFDLSNIQIPDADLSYGIFDGTDFTKADLTRVCLQSAWLRNAKFNCANMQDVYFGVRPPIPHKGIIRQIICSTNERWLAARSSKVAYIFNLVTSDFLHIVNDHTEEINDIAFSMDEKFLATCSRDKTIRLWDVATGKLVHLLNMHRGFIFRISFHPNNRLLASCSNDTTIRIWDINEGKCLKTFKGTGEIILTVQFSPDGKYLAAADAKGTVLWCEVATWQLKYEFKAHTDSVYHFIFSPNGQILASGSEDHDVRLWNVNSGEIKFLLKQNGEVKKLAFSPDGNFLAVAVDLTFDCSTTIWDTVNGELYYTFYNCDKKQTRDLSFNQDGKLLAIASSDNSVHVIDVYAKQELMLLRDTSDVAAAIFSSFGNYLISGGYSNFIKFWEIKNRKIQNTYHGGEITNLDISPDGSLLAYGNEDGTAYFFDLKVKKVIRTFRGEKQISSVAYSSDGKLFATGCWDHYVRVWDLESNQLIKSLPLLSYSVAFSKNCKLLVAGGGVTEGSVKIWQVGTWEEYQSITMRSFVSTVAVSPNNTQLAIGNYFRHNNDTTGWLREIKSNINEESGNLPGVGGNVNSMKFSPDGHILAVGVNKVIGLYDISKAQFSITLKGHVDQVKSVAFSPDGKLLASGSADNTVHVWDVVSYKCLLVIIGQSGCINSVVWQDNQTLISASSQGYLNCWRIDNQNNKYINRLLWCTQDTLYAEKCQFNEVENLSELNAELLYQLQGGSKPIAISAHSAFPTAEKFNEENVEAQAIWKKINNVLIAGSEPGADISTVVTKIFEVANSAPTKDPSPNPIVDPITAPTNKPAAAVTLNSVEKSEATSPAKSSDEVVKNNTMHSQPAAAAQYKARPLPPVPLHHGEKHKKSDAAPPEKLTAVLIKNVGIYSQPAAAAQSNAPTLPPVPLQHGEKNEKSDATTLEKSTVVLEKNIGVHSQPAAVAQSNVSTLPPRPIRPNKGFDYSYKKPKEKSVISGVFSLLHSSKDKKEKNEKNKNDNITKEKSASTKKM